MNVTNTKIVKYSSLIHISCLNQMSREKQQVKSVAMHNPEGNFVLAK